MGCPSVDIIVTELIMLGARRFVRVGTAGSLQPHAIRMFALLLLTFFFFFNAVYIRRSSASPQFGDRGQHSHERKASYVSAKRVAVACLLAYMLKFLPLFHMCGLSSGQLADDEYQTLLFFARRNFLFSAHAAGGLVPFLTTLHSVRVLRPGQSLRPPRTRPLFVSHTHAPTPPHHYTGYGDIVIANAAVRDEGTSRHYAPLEFPAVASPETVQALSQAAQNLGLGDKSFIGIVHSKVCVCVCACVVHACVQV